MMDRFRQKFAMLARQPLIGEACDDLRPGLRLVPLGNYVIYYRVDDDHVTIVRVLHGGRDATRLL